MRPYLQHVIRIFIVSLIGASSFAATLVPTATSVPGEVLVKIQPSTSSEQIATLQNGIDVDQAEQIANVASGAIWRMHSRSLSTADLATALQNSPNVVYAEPNYIVHALDTPNDTLYAQLWGLKNTGQTISGVPGTAGADISAEAAWSVTTGSASVVVGVVDTGVDYTHADLAANTWSNPGGKGNVACAAGTHGFNAITKTCDPRDDHYHGTHVSGTIGAIGNNSLGVVGVNWTASIMGLKFLDSSGSGTTADAITVIDFAVQAKIDGVNVRILSNSWGGGAFSKALLDEINKANDNDILFVAAAGNDSANNDTYQHYPASYATQNMIAVAATDNRDALAYFSDYGPNTVHLGAPGVNVLSCAPGGTYQTLSGTSMATPHVSGVAALVLAKTPGLTTAQVKSAILDNTDPISSLSGKTVTGGRLNAARAVGAPIAPTFSISASPSLRSISPGNATTYSITITPSNGFAGSVDLSVSGLPTGASGVFNPTPATTASTLTITTGNATPLGTSSLTITGTSGAITHSTSATLTMVTKPPVTACPSFAPPLNYYASYGQASVAVADFNRDGKADLAVVSSGSNTVSILLGAGNGFQYPVSYVVGTAPVSVAIGDFNGDGKVDLAVANSVSNSVSILLGNGDGTFQSAANYSAGTSPFWVAVGDFNGDGKTDLAVANNGSANVSILSGNGDGTFQAPVNYNAGSGPFWVSVGDLNGDGKADLAVADYNGAKVSVLLGNGDGSFQTAVAYAVGNGPSSVAIADFDGNGKADLAVSNYVSNNVSVLAGNGDGTFQAAVNYAVGSGPYSVAVLDVNGDGKPDLAVTNSISNNVSVLSGRGNGTFLPAINYGTDVGPTQVAVGDFNGDGKPDLGVATGNYLSILLNNGVCSANCDTIAPAVNYTAGTTPDSMAIGDFNGDGLPDLAVVNNGSNNVSIALGNSDGTFQPAGTYGAGSAPVSVSIGDFNGDGKLDLAVANSGSNDVSILLGNGNGTFQGATSYGCGTTPHSVTVGDFNRDGKADLAVANNGSNNVSILLGNGTGTFATAVNYGVGTNPESVAIGDFNRDGKVDLAVANSGSRNVSILAGKGDGTFQTATSVAAGTSPMFVITEDFDHNGKTDLAVANSGSNNVSILLGNGDGTFHAPLNYGTGTSPVSVTIGDFNDDGKLDLAVANNGSSNVSILLGNGDGTFGGAVNSAAGAGPHFIAARDFNRDGKPDLAVANAGAGSFSILLNTCPVPDLAVTVTHSGNFAQGDTGKVYTITVSNIGIAPTNDVVTAVDLLPTGLTATAMSGTGWTCNLPTVTCTRSDALTAATSYQPITLTVNVANNTKPSVTNAASVSGGGEVNNLNDSATDPTTVTPVTDLIVTSTHAGSFTQGSTGKTYQITARNAGGSPTTGTVTVTESVPAGLTATAISGTGWSCNLGMLACTRSDALAASSNYPIITVTVNVAANAPSVVTNMATVSGGGESNTANDTAIDPTTIWMANTCASFAGPSSFGIGGSSPTSIAIGDFNGDGKADLVITSSYSNNVLVFLGNGTGLFQPGIPYGAGTSPISIIVADLNNDGKADLAVVNSYSNNVSVLLGKGDGTFAAAVNYAVGINPQKIAVGDFNGDGIPDLAVINYYSNNVSILLGNGDGTLQTAVNYNTGYSPGYIVSADFNGDGKADLAIAYSYSSTGSILLGNGDGTFQAGFSFTTGYSPSGLVVGDFNADGKPDLAVSSYYGSNVGIVIGNGNGTFQTPVTYTTSYGSASLSIEDLNGDGKPDIAVANSGSNSVSVLLGNGDGTFQTALNYLNVGTPSQIVGGDFNGDGRPDLATINYYQGSIGILLGGCADLTISKTHSGNFIGGQTNVPYTITVSNSGGGSSAGTVTVTDALPNGLTATAMSGFGWTCDLANTRCTRSDSLLNGASFPVITLNVTVSKTAPSSVTNTATVSGGGDTNLANNSASDPTTINQVADLTITKTHNGTFAQGQIGRIYTITVTNSGATATSGTVSVADSLPGGLTATGMAGAGWSCNLPSRTCTRSDALAVNSSYPAITLTVNVDSNAPASVTNMASVSGGGEVDPSNDSASDVTRIIATPTNLVATAISTTQASLTWDPVVNATNYQVLRSSNNGPFTMVGIPVSNGFTDTSLTPGITYLYRIQAADATVVGSPGNVDLATTILFTDDPIISGSTRAKAVHIMELRAAVSAVRAAAGLPPANFSDGSLTAGFPIKAVYVTELRSSLDAARAVIGVPAMVYTDPMLGPGYMIRAAHLRDLRAGVK
jgi:uncharacterized repeat protein (TIGR01451 family)